MQALRAHPKDSELLKCIGNIYDEQGDRSQAFQYYHDVSYLSIIKKPKIKHSNNDPINWFIRLTDMTRLICRQSSGLDRIILILNTLKKLWNTLRKLHLEGRHFLLHMNML